LRAIDSRFALKETDRKRRIKRVPGRGAIHCTNCIGTNQLSSPIRESDVAASITELQYYVTAAKSKQVIGNRSHIGVRDLLANMI
jgi:hypothetical protein